jgi:glycosyltransferase involved in cell wall biosynthesis
MKELYIIDSCYNATAAATNRLFAFALALKNKGVCVTFFYLFPYGNKDRCERHTNDFNFVYLWEDSWTNNKYINTVRSLHIFYTLMRPGIPVYAYSLLNCIYFLRKKKGVRLFHEYTENPEVVGRLNGVLGFWLYFLYKKAIPKLDGLFLITPALRNKFIYEFGVSPEKTDLINMTVDQNRFNGLPDDAPANIISYCGSISEIKDGVSTLIRAFALVLKKYPDYKLKIIGPFANKEVEDILKSLIKDLGVENNVIFTGPIKAEIMPALLKASKILALARPDNSQSKYGFATKIGEYLMTERPTVLTRVGAVEVYLKDKESCILASPDSIEDFADKLMWTIENYKEAIEIGKKGKQVALKYFNSEIEAEKIYNRIFHFELTQRQD